MALANDMTALLDKIEMRLGLVPITPHLPEKLSKPQWAQWIKDDTMMTFSRYYPNMFPMTINDDTTVKVKEKNGGETWYYIKDEYLEGVKLFGIEDIDWTDYGTRNSSLGATSLGGGYYYPNYACPMGTFENILAAQEAADFSSLYNRGLYIDFRYPNKFRLKGLGNTSYDLTSFVVKLLVNHRDLSTISPTKMEIFEELCQCDIARYIWMNLRYYDNLETIYVGLDLKLSDLQSEADKRESVLDKIKDAYVSTSNDNIPYIWTI